jgi:chromosome segregation ATPase
METLYVWLFFFAGATMIVQGICLLASERELRKQRREIDMLRRNHRPSELQGFETQSSAELMTRNKELIEKISSLSSELEESKRMMEDLQRHQRVSDSELKQQLQASQETIKELEAEQQRLVGINFENQQLRDEIANLKIQFQASQIRFRESAWQNGEATEDYEQLQREIVELKRQAEHGQATARELEAVKEQLSAVESRERIFKDQQHKLEAQIENLQRALFMAKRAVQELDATSERLAGMERVCQELREENRRLEDDISLLRVQPAAVNSRGGSEFSERWLR